MYLRTKIYPPPLSHATVIRDRLFISLDQAYQSGKHTIVTAGAGFGKSTLLAQWIAQNDIQSAWISLDEKDNDLRRFLGYIATALGDRYPFDSKSILSVLADSDFKDFDLVADFILEGIGKMHERAVIILDDYHRIVNVEIQKVMGHILKHYPENGSVVLLSRMDPPLPLSGLRLKRRLTEIRENELKFRSEEVAGLIASKVEGSDGYTPELKETVLSLLMTKTEGWAVGIQLALLAWKQENNQKDFIDRFSGTHVYVADYLMEEVLKGLTPEEERLFLISSLFERFTLALLEAVLKTEITIELEYTAKSGLFLIPLDDDRKWFRLHHLVKDLLRKRALNNHEKNELNTIYTLAGHWFEENGYIDESVECFHEAGLASEIIRLISVYGLKQIATGDLKTISDWLNCLPEGQQLSTPDLCVIQGWIASINQQIDRNEYISKIAESIYERDGQHYIEDIEAHLALLKANYLVQKDGVSLDDIEPILQTAEMQARSSNLLLHSIIQLYRGNVYRMAGELNQALSAYRNTILYAGQINDFSLILPTTTASCEIYFLQGNFGRAEEELKRTLEKVYSNFSLIRMPKVGLLHIQLAMILFEKNQTDEASIHLAKAEEISDRTNDYNALVICYDLKARLHLLQNEISQAREYLDRAMKLSEKRQLLYHSAYLVHLTFLIRKQFGNRVAIEQCLDLIEEHSKWNGFWLGQLELTKIKTFYELDRLNEAIEEAMKLKQESIARGAGFVEFQANCWISVLQWKSGKHGDSLEALHHALIWSEGTGIIRPLLDTGTVMVQIVRKYAADQTYQGVISVDFIQKLITAFDGDLLRTPEGLSEPLSARELDVLYLLAAGFSNKEIAGQLFLALGTVKKHTFTIYQKLDVKNRIQAVDKARSLRLI